MYEFRWPSVLEAFGAAAKAKAKVTVIYDAVPGATKPGVKNLQAITDAGIGNLVKPRIRGTIMHNKFIVLSKTESQKPSGPARPTSPSKASSGTSMWAMRSRTQPWPSSTATTGT